MATSKPIFKFLSSLSNFRLRTKLLLGFGAIILMNASSGLLNLGVIERLGELVNVTYDRALMAGNFAQAAKFDFAKIDLEVLSALHASDLKQFQAHSARATRASETLSEDLQVVAERAPDEKSVNDAKAIKGVLARMEEEKQNFLAAREAELHRHEMIPRRAAIESWSANTTKLEVEQKLTALYDDAAEAGYRFRLDSETNNRRNLTVTTWALGAGLLASILLSTLFSFRLMKPLKILYKTCLKFEEGNYNARAGFSGRDEFGSLARAFDAMLEKIEQRDNDMSALLTALPFGVFYFDRSGEISKQYSKTTEDIFKNFKSAKRIETFMKTYAVVNETALAETLNIVFDEMLPFASAVELLPSKLKIESGGDARFVNLIYRPERDNAGKVMRIIVIAEDVTEKMLALKQTEMQAERVKRIATASKDIGAYREFEPEAEEYFVKSLDALKSSPNYSSDEFKRDLHSLKGLLGVYEFREPANLVHKIESRLNDSKEAASREEIEQLIRQAFTLFQNQAGEVSKILGLKENADYRLYDSRKITKLVGLAHSQMNEEVLEVLATLERYPISKIMAKYVSYCARISESLGDKLVELRFDADSSEISYSEAQSLDAALIHILRNCLDHGIESCDQRVESGKSETGTILISCRRDASGLRIIIADDGAGINANRLAEKAVASGYWTAEKARAASANERIQLIFASGLSTKTEASEVSGRGVGMDAVKADIEALRGTIAIETEPGQGTKFIIQLPGQARAESPLARTA